MPMIDIHAAAGSFSDPLRRNAGVGAGHLASDADREMMIGRRSLSCLQTVAHSTSTIISTSTALLKGSPAIPTAERACLPAVSPKTSTIRSEKPLMTRG